MPKKEIVIFDPKSNEYLYDVLLNAPAHAKRDLNPQELAQIRNPSAIKKFVNNSVLDKKLALFSKMGMEWCLLFFNPSIFDFKDLEAAYKQYAIEGQPLENMNEMIRSQTFVTTSKEIALGLSMMASNCHSGPYEINREFLKVRENITHLGAISKNADRNRNVEYLKTEKAMQRVSRLLFFALMLDNYLEAVAGLQKVDLLVLVLLYGKPNSYFRIDVIQKKLSAEYKALTVATRCRKLWEAGYLEKIPTASKKPAYQIKAKGVLILGDILHHLVNHSDNEL